MEILAPLALVDLADQVELELAIEDFLQLVDVFRVFVYQRLELITNHSINLIKLIMKFAKHT